MKKWIITILLATTLLALAVATHFWGARIIKFAIDNDKTVDALKKLLELLIAIGGLAVPIIKWAFGKTRQPNPPDEAGHHIPALEEYVPKPRVLDAAIPSHVVKDRLTELLILVRLPNSPGLNGSLLADEDAEAQPEDVLSKQFKLFFEVGPNGKPEPIRVAVSLTSPDFLPPQQTKNLFVPPDSDSEVLHFLLTPKRIGRLKVLIELQWQDALHGSRSLRTECVAEAEGVPTPAMNLAQMQVSASMLPADLTQSYKKRASRRLQEHKLERVSGKVRESASTADGNSQVTKNTEGEFTDFFREPFNQPSTPDKPAYPGPAAASPPKPQSGEFTQMWGEDPADDDTVFLPQSEKGIDMSDEKSSADQSGGVNISGGTVNVGGDIVGRDKIVGTEISRVQLDHIFRPIEEAVRTAPPANQSEAIQKLEELKIEAAKGKNASDGVVAKLLEGLVGLIPGAVSAVVSAFATPLLGGIAGPATKYVLDKIKSK